MRRTKKSFSMQTNISYNKVNAFYTSKMKSANSHYNINKHMDHQRIYLRKFQIIVLIILIYETCVLLFKQPAAPYHQLGMIKGSFFLQFFIEHFNDLWLACWDLLWDILKTRCSLLWIRNPFCPHNSSPISSSDWFN